MNHINKEKNIYLQKYLFTYYHFAHSKWNPTVINATVIRLDLLKP